MRRREFIALLTAALAPVVAVAQKAKIYRVGFIWDGPAVFADELKALWDGLEALGYVEGQNLIIEKRWAAGDPARMREFAEELVRLRVDVIVAPSSVYTEAAKQATSSIPIIFLGHADPVNSGHVANLARPGGNISGMTIMMTETNVKGVELFKEALPGLQRIAVMFDPATPSHHPGLRAVIDAGPALGLGVQPVPVRSADEYEAAFALMSKEGVQGVLVLSTPLYIAGAQRLADLGLVHKLPSLYGPKHHVEAGGLMSYSPDRVDLYRRGATYVDKVLKGGSPADLPVQQATKFELTINLKTAKALGIELAQAFVARADEVIE